MTVLLLIYKYAFQNSLGGDYGMAAALSLMLAAFLAVFTGGLLLAHPALEHGLVSAAPRRRERRPRRRPTADRGIVSARRLAPAPRPLDHARRSTWRCCVFLLIVGLGPLLWMLKSSITPTQDTLRQPMALWPQRLRPRRSSRRPGTRSTSTATSFNTVVDRVRVVGSSSSSSRRRPASRCRVLRPRYARRPDRRWSSRRCSCRRSCCSCRST